MYPRWPAWMILCGKYLPDRIMDAQRAEAIAKAVAERVERLKEHIRSREYGRDDLAHDVKRNIAYSGTEQRRKGGQER